MGELEVIKNDLETGDVLADFGRFLRLHVADGDASERTIRAYYSNARAFVEWCEGQGIDPAQASEEDLIVYRRHLVDRYARSTSALKLAAVKRLYEAACWRGLH